MTINIADRASLHVCPHRFRLHVQLISERQILLKTFLYRPMTISHLDNASQIRKCPYSGRRDDCNQQTFNVNFNLLDMRRLRRTLTYLLTLKYWQDKRNTDI